MNPKRTNILSNLNDSTTSTSDLEWDKIITAANVYNPTWTTTNSPILTTWETDKSYVYYSDNSLLNIFSYLSLDEIIELLEKIKSRGMEIRGLVSKLVGEFNLPEKFLMKFIDYLTLEQIKIKHAREINSGEYSEVCLYFELKKI